MKNTLKIIFRFLFFLNELNIGMSKGSVSAASRKIDDSDPLSWEFSSFSQNGEDGIINYLVSKLLNSNKYFIEIGSSNGLANNSAYFALVKQFCGLMVEGNKLHSKLTSIIYNIFNKGVTPLNIFVDKKNIDDLLSKSITKSPDIFSIDIDGNDYYLVQSILEKGFKPKIFVVEYNANYGPDKSITIPYNPNFNYATAHSSRLYYGVSITAWRNLFEKYGYEFVTVESNGINAFFILKEEFPENFMKNKKKIFFKDHKIELQLFKKPWSERFKLISNMPYNDV
jgi:hypothetical protein